MVKIVFLGAGSTVFAKSVLGDCLHVPELKDAHIALVDIDPERLADSETMIQNLNRNLSAQATVQATVDRRKALAGADFVVNAIQVGGYEPSTVIDFEVPKKYGLRQTIGDTLGIGGIFRALRTIPVMLEFAHDIQELCPDAWFLNYTNPMGMLTGAILRATGINMVGLCHSVQGCATHLCGMLELPNDNLQWRIAGINHQGWLLELSREGVDLYPEVKRRAALPEYNKKDAVRFEVMKRFGYYVTESSEHSSEYLPYFIKSTHPELIDRFHIPLDEYPRRCIGQIEGWKKMRQELTESKDLVHNRGGEYASYIIESVLKDVPYSIGGNVLNNGLITNLPFDCCVEVPCLINRNGVQGCYVGALPPQCAAVTQTNVNVQLLTIEAALTQKRDHVYHAALLDPHTSAELTIDEIVALCDDLIEAHGDMLPTYA
ncbi:MAG: alpha-glucosidase/alpha-galactosidase [Armatimonadetes bacterium CG_4_10_14_0_8_um_filter_66_14]|nr:alpha-glucosidase/alpha-galactosidase [Armatimonadota bacterium]OIP04213.1 MAG: alpha-glucosidase/alpha-galactosidase [Armatimonadetes bacterium CG2_30_66_41]PIX37295.1 MAG: alpha-glucosidase/alpha-galactosidase [Armatimonadetes bacterium CG_4_8_14_3_um_filter_66_20]PIZ47743.1 MAG: alpha-glucosidase/alpha-galactosidase [Armatimonadetes bacterium CG_4_10_14_0_8_um_filter_66_14]PJB71134.1 MAG: alpha-glucosidase/alpha-galactosidase [Armatimonadetes bacterium CG_4_9_14_3_um_filter_66_14]